MSLTSRRRPTYVALPFAHWKQGELVVERICALHDRGNPKRTLRSAAVSPPPPVGVPGPRSMLATNRIPTEDLQSPIATGTQLGIPNLGAGELCDPN